MTNDSLPIAPDLCETDAAPTTRQTPRTWRAIVRPYERASDARAAWQLLATWAPLLALMYLMHRALAASPWAAVALSIPIAGFLVRTFIVMHDCAHGSFFSSRR